MGKIFLSCVAIFLVLGILINLPLNVHGCGMVTHNLIAERAVEFYNAEFDSYNDLLAAYRDALQGGAPFPDYLYSCGDDHDAGEEAHWTPFQIAAANYIRDTYPSPRNESGDKLVVFMLGVVSHYIADMIWHGLSTIPTGEGFIRQLGIANFNCSGDLCDSAHGAADTGGEFTAAHQANLDWLNAASWYVPVNDLVNIYTLANETLDPSYGPFPLIEPLWIEECSLKFMAASIGVKYFGDLIYPYYAQKAPFLPENFIEFPVGGVDDNAMWTGWMWNRFSSWVELGPPNDPPYPSLPGLKPSQDLQSLVQSFKSIVEYKSEKKSKAFKVLREDELNTNGIKINFELDAAQEDGTFLQIAEALNNWACDGKKAQIFDKEICESGKLLHELKLRAKKLQYSSDLSLTKQDQRKLRGMSEVGLNQDEPISTLTGDSAREYFGNSVAFGDMNNDGCEDLIIGSTGFGIKGYALKGKVSIFLGCNSDNSFQNPDLVLYGTEDGRFGSTIKIGDLNGDNIDDLVVGSPTFGVRENISSVVGNYSGRVDIFYGPIISSTSASDQTPDLTLYGEVDWGLFGSSIDVLDIDGDSKDDLVVAAPWAGDNNSDTSSKGTVYIYLTTKSERVVIQSENDFELFGFHVKLFYSDQSTGYNSMLLVGAPWSRTQSDLGAYGKLYAFDLSTLLSAESTLSTIDSTWSISSSELIGKFGHSFDIQFTSWKSGSTPLLIVSSPTHSNSDYLRNNGKVTLIPLSLISSGEQELSDIEAYSGVVVIDGKEEFGRFGWNVKLIDDGFIVSSFLAPGKVTDRDAGRLQVFKFSKFDIGELNPQSEVEIYGSKSNARLGASFDVMKNSDSSYTLLVGAPHAFPAQNAANDMNGQAFLYDFSI